MVARGAVPGMKQIVAFYQQAVQVRSQVHFRPILGYGRQVSGGLPVEEPKFLQVGAGERGCLIPRLINECFEALPKRSSAGDPATRNHVSPSA